jgi:hypothetical protein
MTKVLFFICVCAGLRDELRKVSVQALQTQDEAFETAFQTYSNGELSKLLYSHAATGKKIFYIHVDHIRQSILSLLPENRPWPEKTTFDLINDFVDYWKKNPLLNDTTIERDSYWNHVQFLWD